MKVESCTLVQSGPILGLAQDYKKEYKLFFFLDVSLEKSMLKLLQHLNIMKDEIKHEEEAECICSGLDPWTFQLNKKQMNLCIHK